MMRLLAMFIFLLGLVFSVFGGYLFGVTTGLYIGGNIGLLGFLPPVLLAGCGWYNIVSALNVLAQGED